MKNIRKYIFIALGFAVLGTGCEKLGDFGDTNIDPTKVDKPATKALLTYSLQRTQASDGGSILNSAGSIFAQFVSEGPYLTVSPFNDATTTLNRSYYAYYAEILKNLNQIITFASSNAPEAAEINNGSLKNQIAIARILKAYTFWKATDKWGDLPYTEALSIDNITPKFTKQEDIYKDLFKELKEAVAQMDNGPTVLGDILFGGDMAAWKKFAATQRLIMALRLSKVYPSAGQLAAQEFNLAVAAGPLMPTENVEYQFLSTDPNNYNPWYTNYTVSNRNDFAVSKTLVDIMKDNGTGTDPRLPVYAEVLPGDQIIGLEFGTAVQTNIPNSFSRIGLALRSANTPSYIFTGAQVQFAMAEAAKLGWIAGGDVAAKTFYETGIGASLIQYGVADGTDPATNNQAYKNAAKVLYNPATAIEQISTQRWIALYLNGWEAWHEFRRTGFPALKPGPNSQNGTNIPRRVGYPTADQNTNRDNYNAALAQQGWTNNGINNRMWWDKP